MYGKNACCPLGDPLEIPIIKGDTGPEGPMGPTGMTGKDGKDGVDGVDGKDGENGLSIGKIELDTYDPTTRVAVYNVLLSDGSLVGTFKVSNGEAGIQGEKGEKGDKGDKGDQGEVGPQGPQGEQGPKGDSADVDLTDYLTKSEASSLYQEIGDYVTVDYVTNAIAKAQLSGEVDLDNYYTKDVIDSKMSWIELGD